MTVASHLTDYDLGFIAGVAHALDTLTPKDTDMPKKTRPTRAQQDRQIRKIASSVNVGFAQIAHEIDQLQTILSAVVEVQGIGEKVVEHIKAGQQATLAATSGVAE